MQPQTEAPLVVYHPSDARIAEVKNQLATLLGNLPALVAAEDSAPIKEALNKDVVPLRMEIERLREDFKREHLVKGRLIDSEANRLKALVAAIEMPLKAAADEVTAKQKARAEAKVAEQERIEREAREKIEREEAARQKAIRDAEEAESQAERKKLAEERAAFEAQQRAAAEERRLAIIAAEQEARDRAEKEAAARKADDERRAAEKAAIEAQAAKVRTEQEALDRAKFEQEAQERAERELQEKLDREEKAKIAAEREAAARREREAAEKKAEEEARPDVQKVHSLGDSTILFAQLDVDKFKTKAAQDFMRVICADLTAIGQRMKKYGKKAGKAGKGKYPCTQYECHKCGNIVVVPSGGSR